MAEQVENQLNGAPSGETEETTTCLSCAQDLLESLNVLKERLQGMEVLTKSQMSTLYTQLDGVTCSMTTIPTDLKMCLDFLVCDFLLVILESKLACKLIVFQCSFILS